MFTLVFWRATAERALSTAAQAALLILGADQINVVSVDWLTVAGFAAGGAALTVIKALAFGGRDGNPSATNAETATSK
jgi:hypothetical protein